ncbi:permease [Heliobacterium chlorum]|uniref:Permease n=1 Tax=Heliobacterium chlorum TaxID=2698 RepID=A0ABR7T795_HELCL|nr:permease [Heliobacterium chlorum]MBC9786648.1 permease [Heliobacterium chlorum]
MTQKQQQSLGPNNIHSVPSLGTTSRTLIFPILFLLVAVIGLFYVKWNPYYAKAFTAATTHSIGASIISGKAAVAPAPSWESAIGYATDYFRSVWKAVLLGLLLGSLVQVLIPIGWVQKCLGQKSFKSTALATATALPGMMCSCCAAPVTVGLRTQSASVGSALAFFLANPVLNPATIIFMGFVLSWKFALFRLIGGIILILAVGTIANRVHTELPNNGSLRTVDFKAEEHPSSLELKSLFDHWMKALWKLIIDTIPAYLIVVLLLGSLRAWLFPAIDPETSNGILTLVGLAVAGTLFVIPTAAEIPIVQTMMAFGLGTGPAVTLMMTLPAVSLPSLLIVKRAFPKKVLAFTIAAVAFIGVVSGLVAKIIL